MGSLVSLQSDVVWHSVIYRFSGVGHSQKIHSHGWHLILGVGWEPSWDGPSEVPAHGSTELLLLITWHLGFKRLYPKASILKGTRTETARLVKGYSQN